MSSTAAALPLAAALVLSACGSGDDEAALETPTPAAAPQATATPSPTPRADASPPDPAGTTPPPAPREPGEVAVPRVADTVVTGLVSPWGLAFLPDGSALVTERDTGRVLRVQPGSATQAGSISGVSFDGEGGLLGVAVSPSFADDRLVYLYATTPRGNQVLRARLDGDLLTAPEVLLDDIPSAFVHNGGRLAFGPDGMLYVTTGDARDAGLSQQPDSLAGKILRLTPDGEVPADNPDPSSPVWSSGHRNVQGLAWDDEGNLWASEFGNDAWDELNRIEPGGNYGWPQVEGRGGTDAGFVDPVVQWPTDQASPSGVAFAEGTVFMAALRGQRLWGVPVGGGQAGEPAEFFAGELGRLRTVASAPDGSLWLVTNNTDTRGQPRPDDDRILRLELG
jgi:glucose/arabinose dehydrogenase